MDLHSEPDHQPMLGGAAEDAVCPSAASTSGPCLVHLRPAEIVLPADSAANDVVRVHNGGRALQGGFVRSDSLSWPSPLQHRAEPGLNSLRPRRVPRGLVRNVSLVGLHYPDVNPYSTPPHQLLSASLQGSRATWATRSDQSLKPMNSKSLSLGSRRDDSFSEPFWPKTFSIPKEGEPSWAQKRAANLQNTLQEMRRISPNLGCESPGGSSELPATPSKMDEGPMKRLLKDLADTEEYVQQVLDWANPLMASAAGFGGARHATAVIAYRTAAVAERKAKLLHSVEARIASLEQAHAECNAILASLLAGSAEVPPTLKAIPRFIRDHTHRPGNPADADRSDFESFARSFKLPADHHALERLWELTDEVGEWWAQACIDEALKGANHNQLRRLFDVALGTGVAKDHPKMFKATKVITDRLAEKVAADARERQKQDKIMEERSKKTPSVGPASEKADKIEEEIFKAIEDGVGRTDPRLEEARLIVKSLREADGVRKRLFARERRLSAEAASQ